MATFEEILGKPLDEMTEEEVAEVAERMKLSNLIEAGKAVRKVVRRKPKADKKKAAKEKLMQMIAMGLKKDAD